MSKRFASCGPSARSPTQSDATTSRKFELIASIAVARTQPLVVQPTRTMVSTPFDKQHAGKVGAEEGRGLGLPDHQFARPRRERVHHLAAVRGFGQFAEPRHLLAPDAAVGAVVGIDDAGEGDRQASGAEEVEERHGGGDGLGDVAAAEHLRVGEAVDEVDDEQDRLPAEAGLLPEGLLPVDVVVRPLR